MLESVAGAPEGVLAFEAVGKITAEDYETTLEPAIAEALEAHGGLRVVLVLGNRWDGLTAAALWDDLRVGLGNARSWRRCAVVTERAWIEHAVKAFGWMAPGEVRIFDQGELDDALVWAGGSS